MLHDLHIALRGLRRVPGFAVVVVVTLALGIGATTAIYSVVNGVLLTPLPYPQPDRLVLVWEQNPHRGSARNTVSPANYLDWRDRARSFSGLAAFTWTGITLTGGTPEHVEGRAVTPEFFSVLRVDPAIGRTFTAEESAPGATKVVVLSHGLWQRRFGGDSSIVGRTIAVAGGDVRVVGVMPASFQSMPLGLDQFWQPLGLDPADRERRGRYAMVIGRLRDGVTAEAAQAEMTSIAADLAREHVDFNTGWGANVVTLTDQVVGRARPVLLTLLGAVSLVLLIACANVANLMLARTAARRRELAVRAALGASPRRLAREVLTESVVLAAIGGAAGVVLAVWGVELLVTAAPAEVPRLAQIGVDGRVLAVTAAVTLLVGILFGSPGALGRGSDELAEDLHGAGRRATVGAEARRLRGALVVAQVSLSMVLLVGAGLLIRSLQRLTAVDPGFDASQLLTVAVDLPAATYPDDPRRSAFYTELLRRARAMPGVQSAAMIDFLPLAGPGSATSFTVVGRPAPAPGQVPVADIRVVDPQYFQTMRIPLRGGRIPDERDRVSAPPVVVINETMARSLWPGEDPVGRRVKVNMWDPDAETEVIGVVGDVRQDRLDGDRRAMIYYPAAQAPTISMNLVLRTAGPPLDLAAPMRAAVREIDSDQPVGQVTTMQSIVRLSIADRRFPMFLLSLFAGLAVTLAAVGIYGVLSYSVGLRSQEIGVRMALGARVTDILGMVLKQGGILVAVGGAVGLGSALALSRVLRGLLFGITPADPGTYLAVCLVLALVALGAMALPARRAAAVDPMRALKSE
jgi:putative ABC transport system permease protein